MSKYQNFSIGYFLTRSTFLGIGFSLLINLTKQDSIISFLGGTIIGLLIILVINKIQEYKGNNSLKNILLKMGSYGIILRIILIILGICLFVSGLVALQILASSFFLVKTPLFFILLPVILLIILINNKGLTVINRVSSCLFPISVFLTLISLFALFGDFKIDNITPLFVNKAFDIFKSMIFYVALTCTPNILNLIQKENNTNNGYPYLLASFTLITKVLLIIGILGPILACIYRYPEYLILREIRLMNFIEKIENIVALSWIFDSFIYLAMSSAFIFELLPNYKKNIFHTILIVILYFITFKVIGKNYVIELLIYKFLPYICLITNIIVIPSLFIYLKTKNKKINT